MDNALHPRLGGPMGRHALRQGMWFSPLLTIVGAGTGIFLVLFFRHLPCLQTEADNPINAYIRVCYSDIQTTFLSQGWGEGVSPLASEPLWNSPLVAMLVLATTGVVAAVGAPIGPAADLQSRVDASLVFFATTTVVVYVSFLATAFALAYLGRGASRGRASWDAVWWAASPIVLAAGLISWTLVPIAITAVGLVLFARRRTVAAGVVLGVAACAGTMPIAVVCAITLACMARAGWRTAATFAGPAVATFTVIHLPLILGDASRVFAYYQAEVTKETGYGSLWYLASLLGINIRGAGSLAFILLVLFLAGFSGWLLVTRRSPRVALVVAVFVGSTVLLGPAYPPQTSLWVLFVVILALPFRRELIALTVVEVGYCMAIWGWLGGGLTLGQSGPYLLYWLAIVARSCVHAWLILEAILAIVEPRRDRMRTLDQLDPIGGVLNDGEAVADGPPVPAGYLGDYAKRADHGPVGRRGQGEPSP